MSEYEYADNTKTQRYFDDQFLQRKVKVYIRTVTRKSIKIQLPAEIHLNLLKQIIRKKFQISQANQIIYLKGTQLNFSGQIFLQNDWIVHVVNLSQVKLHEINFEIKASSLQKPLQCLKTYNAVSKTLIRQFVQKQILNQFSLKLQQIMLVQSGRILKMNSSFMEQNIQNGTSINLIHIKKDKKNKLKTQNQLKNFQSDAKQFKNLNKKAQEQNDQENSVYESLIKESNKIQKSLQNIKRQKMGKKSQKCKIHQKNNENKFRYSSHNIETNFYLNLKKNNRDLSARSVRTSRQSEYSQNKSIPIGERECNCPKHEVREQVTKFISFQDRKRLSKQIREQNLHKLMIKKQRQEKEFQRQIQEKQKQKEEVQTQKQSNLINVEKKEKVLNSQGKQSQNNQRKTLKKVRSLETLSLRGNFTQKNEGDFTERKQNGKNTTIKNPEKILWKI